MSEVENETITCQRKTDGVACGTEIPLVKENLSILRADVPLLSAVCPACHQAKSLSKQLSKTLVDQFFKDEIAEEIEEKESGTSMMPSTGIANKVEETLGLLGYKGKAWKDKVSAIVEFARTTPLYQTPQGMHQLLAAWGVDVQHIPMIIQKVFGGADSMNAPNYNFGSQNSGGGFIMQPGPQGQMMLVPIQGQQSSQNPVQPIIFNAGGNQNDRFVRGEDEGEVVIEKLDSEGNVKERVIKSKHKRDSQVEKPEDQTLKIITLFKELGLIQTQQQRTEQQTSRVPDEITETLDQLKDAIINMGQPARERPDKSENEDIKKMAETVNKLTEQIQTYEKEKRDTETKAVKDELYQMKSMIASLQDRKGGDLPAAGLSDTQFGTHTQHKNLETVTESVTHAGDRISQPLNEILKNQQKMNSLLLVRDIEKQDGVVPGTYMKVLMPTSTPGESEVKATVDKWQQKAAASAGGK